MPYGIQQPAVSGQIRLLEKSLGVALFHRRPFWLTAAGEMLFKQVDPFFSSLTELPSQIQGCSSNHLRLAAPAIVLRNYLPKIAKRFKHRYSGFRLTLHDANQAAAEELLRNGDIDMAITELEGTPGFSIKSRTIMRLPLALLVPASRKTRSIQELFRNGIAQENLISLPNDEVISKQFRAGLTKLKVKDTDDPSGVARIGRTIRFAWIGIGLLVALPRASRKNGVRSLPLKTLPSLNVAALWRGELVPLAAALLKEIDVAATHL